MFDTDSLIPAATASLYAMEHCDIVRGNFSRLFQMLVSSFEDETFIERLHKLGPRGTVTHSIKLNPQNNVLCFADKLWFKVKRSSSSSMERFYVSVGLTFKLSEYNCIPYKKIWVSHVAAGPIDLIQYLLGAPSCEKIVCDKLSEHVYDTCFASIEAMFSDGPKV